MSPTLRMFWRAIRLQCPNWGGGPVFDWWLKPRSHCPSCGLPLERGDEGYHVGSYMFNIIASELVFAAVFLGVVVAMWPSPPWKALQVGGVILMVIAPFVFFPFSKTLFLAFDLLFRPARPDELSPRSSDSVH